MGFEFKHKGRLWRADTAKEAVALRNQLEADDLAAVEAGEEDPSDSEEQVWTPDLVVDLLKNCGKKQKDFLRILFEKSYISSKEIIEQLELDSEVSFAGILSGLSKQLKKLNIQPWDLYTVYIAWDTKGKTRNFRLSKRFKWAARELGWPDEWI